MESTFFTRLGNTTRTFWTARATEAAHAPVRTATLSPVCEEEASILDDVEAQQVAPWLSLGVGSFAMELGCGPGRWVRRMARLGAEVVGVDREELFLQEAQRALAAEGLSSRVMLLQCDLAQGIPDEARGPFDVIFISLLLLYLDDESTARLCDFIAQRLKPGGRVIVKESARAARSEEEYIIEGASYAALYRSSRELEALFTSRGLRLLHHAPVQGFPTIDLLERLAQKMGFGSRKNVNRMLSPTGEWWRSIVTRLSPSVVRAWPWLDQRALSAHRCVGDRDYEATQQLWVFSR